MTQTRQFSSYNHIFALANPNLGLAQKVPVSSTSSQGDMHKTALEFGTPRWRISSIILPLYRDILYPQSGWLAILYTTSHTCNLFNVVIHCLLYIPFMLQA